MHSALYYIHVDSDQDEELRREEEAKQERYESDRLQDGSEVQSGAPAIRRKPSPQRPQLALGDRPKPPPKTFPDHQLPRAGLGDNISLVRKPVGHDRRAAHGNVNGAPSLPPGKLLGPRPMQERLHSVDNAALGNMPQRQNISLRRWSEQPPLDPLRYEEVPDSEKLPELEKIYSANSAPWIDPNLIPLHTAMPAPEISVPKSILSKSSTGDAELSLTLIRRYNGTQSNVGRIAPNRGSVNRSLGATLDILSPGYLKYGEREQQNGQECQAIGRPNDRSESTTFQRTLRARSGTQRAFQAIKAGSYESTLPQRSIRGNLDFQKYRKHSPDNYSSFEGTDAASDGPETTAPSRHTFATPWNTVCEFSTGIAGRSLRCKHAPSETGSAGTAALTVSELRFNLPSSQILYPAQKKSHPRILRGSKGSSPFSNRHHRHSSSTSQDSYGARSFGMVLEEHDDNRLDLSLGQERAGGGFGGKQAKLGKLIIEPEGLQMLDLLVAANMAMWWKVYDKLS